MIVGWSLDELPGVLAELAVDRPFLVASPRCLGFVEVPVSGAWSTVPSPAIEVAPGADGILAIGGGSAIDTAKAASAASGLRLVSVPTTYSGAEWTPGFGVRTPDRRIVGGGGGAHLAGIVYDVRLTLGLPRAETVGTALNALAHCAEALYVTGHNPEGDERALAGARAIAVALPEVVASPHARSARARLLRGASDAGQALALAGMGLGHAMAQALGGHLRAPARGDERARPAAALRFNESLAPDAIARFGEAIGAPTIRPRGSRSSRGSAGSNGSATSDLPEDSLPAVAEAAAGRLGNRAKPRPATADEIEELLRSIY